MMFRSKNNDALEDTMLRSVILYRRSVNKLNVDSLLEMTLLGIVQHNGAATIQQITRTLNDRFNLDFTEEAIRPRLQSLKASGLILQNGNDSYSCREHDTEGKFYTELDEKTRILTDGVIERMKKNKSLPVSGNIHRIENNIKSALSAYYHHYGYSFVGLKNSRDYDVEDAEKAARKNLDKKMGDALVAALYGLLKDPTAEEKEVLELWARAFVTMEILNFDPSLRDFKLTKLKDKVFFIDTDVILHCLCSHSTYSAVYQEIFDHIRKNLGCRIIIPEIILPEIDSHAEAAVRMYINHSPGIKDWPDDLLEQVTQNVFIEDYVKRCRDDESYRDTAFKTHIHNIFDKNENLLLRMNLADIFGDNIEYLPGDQMEDLNDEQKQKLAAKIKEITARQSKGMKRRDEDNEDIANRDARIYLTIDKRNKETVTKDPNNKFSHKNYLVTQGHKIRNCVESVLHEADRYSCICSPMALFSILQETGKLNGKPVDYINLFENPFLSFTAEKMKDQLQPLIDGNVDMKAISMNRLRIDVETTFDGLLTADSHDKAEREAAEIKIKGYDDIADVVLERIEDSRAVNAELQRSKEEIAELKRKLRNTGKVELVRQKGKARHAKLRLRKRSVSRKKK